jgi:hypothetical protein
MLIVVFFIIGLFVSGLPQYHINKIISGKNSFANPFSLHKTLGNNKITLLRGITMIRFEGLLITKGIQFSDPYFSGPILKKEKLSPDTFTYKKYFKLMFKYPIEMIETYVLRLTNAMDSSFGQIYIKKPSRKKIRLKSIFSILVWFTGFLGCFVLLNKKYQSPIILHNEKNNFIMRLKKNRQISNIVTAINSTWFWGILYLGFPSFFIFIVHLEPRYFMQMWIILFVFISCLYPYKDTIAYICKYPITTFISFLGFALSLLVLWNITFALNKEFLDILYS